MEDWDTGNRALDCELELEGLKGPTTTSGPDGRWSFRGLGRGCFLIVAEGPMGTRGTRNIHLRPDGSPVREPGESAGPVEIELHDSSCVLVGRAVRPEGAPFHGLLRLRRHGPWPSGDLPMVRTGPDGGFRWEHLPPESFRLTALDLTGRWIPGPWVLLPREEEVHFTVGAGMHELHGRVLEAATGAPVEGAAIRVTIENADPMTARIGSGGTFAFIVEEDAEVGILVEAEGFVSARATSDVSPSGDRPLLVLELVRPGSLSGTVTVAGTGAPASGAMVVVFPDLVPLDMPRGGLRATAGADGRYAVNGLPPGPAVVLVGGSGFVSRSLEGPDPWTEEADTVEIAAGGRVERDLVAVAAPRVRGRVLDAEGRGQTGVAVRADPDYQSDRDSWPGYELFEDREAVTGAGGSFVLPFVLPDRAYMVLARRGEATLAAVSLRTPAAGTGEEVLLGVPSERWIDVRVEDSETGEPIPGIEVEAQVVFPPSWSHFDTGARGRSGPKGILRLGPVPEAPLRVFARGSSPSWTSRSTEVEAGAAGPVVVRVSPLDRPGSLLLEGVVLLPDGQPADGVSWGARPAEAEGCLVTDWYQGSTDTRGLFRTGGFRPGLAEVRAWTRREGRWFSAEAVVEAESRQVTLRLRDKEGEEAGLAGEGQGGIRVRILDPEGRPAQGGAVRFHLEKEDGPPDSFDRTPTGGLCAIPVPADGTAAEFQVEISGASDGSPEKRALGHALLGPFPAREGEVALTLERGLVVEGRIVDAAGAGIPDAEVVLQGQGAPRMTVGSCRTDDEGGFRMSGAGAGWYRLSARAGSAFLDGFLDGVRGGSTEVSLVLSPAPVTLVTVLDPDGKPLEGAVMWTRGPAGTGGPYRSDERGVARLHSLAPRDDVFLEVSPPWDRDDLSIEERSPWKVEDTVIRLSRGTVLEVHVRDAAGTPVPEVVVRAFAQGLRQPVRGVTGDEGTVRLPRLPPGPWGVRATLAGDDGEHGPVTEVMVSADETTAILTLDPGSSLRIRVRGGRTRMGAHAWLAVEGEKEPIRRERYESEEILLRGLREDVTYDLFVRDSDGVRSAVHRGVRPGGSPLEVVLSEGKEVRGRLLLPEGFELQDSVIVVGDASLIPETEWESEDTFRIPGVPPGRWKVRCTITNGETDRVVEGEVTPGEMTVIDAR